MVRTLFNSLQYSVERKWPMILPLDLLVSYPGNMYELTCAAIRRGVQINLAGDEDLSENEGKVVSTAIKQILTEKVKYRLEP